VELLTIIRKLLTIVIAFPRSEVARLDHLRCSTFISVGGELPHQHYWKAAARTLQGISFPLDVANLAVGAHLSGEVMAEASASPLVDGALAQDPKQGGTNPAPPCTSPGAVLPAVLVGKLPTNTAGSAAPDLVQARQCRGLHSHR
jgi:hypothetical protein